MGLCARIDFIARPLPKTAGAVGLNGETRLPRWSRRVALCRPPFGTPSGVVLYEPAYVGARARTHMEEVYYMPNKSNVEMYENITSSLSASKGVFVVDYRGLSVKETQGLRRALRAAHAEMKVYKNNIVNLALKDAGLPDISDKLVGTCAYVFYENDPVDAAKTIKKQAEELKKLEWVAGIADGKALSADEAKAYADLASRDELMAQLVYVVASPLRGIASVGAGPARGLVTALSALSDQKNAA